ncbi:hypothetical protein A2482_01315 [Candidatus Falkowbacteria bacterium RIFOXYC2_FULL_48_21]|uniref:Response regulatory domain-containing protein n=1 Tax=Candidatus Falkowbacteria bacterium RIFOXYC2_FULL_48_21 TaxID=1798005 RepID=A0A1F5TGT7_9BACT|nr:MAG: hypothetical protein A2482_01315 [Candidatus Falkowbacteria bacterium RIFOXYC2_FULL_48_21]
MECFEVTIVKEERLHCPSPLAQAHLPSHESMPRFLQSLLARFCEERGCELRIKWVDSFDGFASSFPSDYLKLDCIIVEVHPLAEESLLDVCELAFEQGQGGKIIFWGSRHVPGFDWNKVKAKRPHLLSAPFIDEKTDITAALAIVQRVLEYSLQRPERRNQKKD